jgi:putative transposase
MIIEQDYGTRTACRLVGASRATLHRRRLPKISTIRGIRTSHRKLDLVEQKIILQRIHEPRFADLSVREIYATLLDEGVYLCSISTMYRILRSVGETRERRRIASHPPRVKPELVAIAPDCVYSWDITKIAGPAKWQWYHLYVVLDVYSRFVVGWRLERNEDGILAEELFAEIIADRGIDPTKLTVHADNGSAMTAKTLNRLFVDLQITRSHSRPHVSNDNPFSEAQFKTMKYGPNYPERFASIEDARIWCEAFFHWYNEQHHHIGIGLLTPLDVYSGRGDERRAARRDVLHAAHAAHPERFVRGLPEPPRLPTLVAINPPEIQAA